MVVPFNHFSDLVVLVSLRAVDTYSERRFSISATRIHARPCGTVRGGSMNRGLFFHAFFFIHPFVHRDILALARDVLMFSMFSMLAMQLFCTLLQATRRYSQKLRCPSELNQLPEPGSRFKHSRELFHTINMQPRQQYSQLHNHVLSLAFWSQYHFVCVVNVFSVI